MNTTSPSRFNTLATAAGVIAAALFFSASCSPVDSTAIYKIKPVIVTIHTQNEELSTIASTNWNRAAAMTHTTLQALQASEPKAMAACKRLFATSNPKDIAVVRDTLQKMDAKFRSGKCQFKFIHHSDDHHLTRHAHQHQMEEIVAFTKLGGNIMHAPSWNRNGYCPYTIIHEMSHMAAHTLDYGYSYTGDLYSTREGKFIKLSTPQLLRNADTYELFVEMCCPMYDTPWEVFRIPQTTSEQRPK